jgi:hypothetical protein
VEADEEISGSEAFKAPICTLFNISLGPPVGAPLSVRAPLEPIKGRARTLERTDIEVLQTHKSSYSRRVRSSSPKTYKQYITQWT